MSDFSYNESLRDYENAAKCATYANRASPRRPITGPLPLVSRSQELTNPTR